MSQMIVYMERSSSSSSAVCNDDHTYMTNPSKTAVLSSNDRMTDAVVDSSFHAMAHAIIQRSHFACLMSSCVYSTKNSKLTIAGYALQIKNCTLSIAH